MRKNTQAVYKAWKQGKEKFGNAISTDGQIIWSYSTPLLFRLLSPENLCFNITHYSSTTTHQQNDLCLLLSQDAIKFKAIKL